ncbi:MAG TPA: patatin-like phospholipase family protein [Cyclobacteriaceae bacterium]
MVEHKKIKLFLDQFVYSFPVQIFFYHCKRNLALLAGWFLLILAITENFGLVYGIPYLYLDPEYLNQVGFWSFFIVGITFGGLTMAFNITSYILDGHRYPFIGILERPFAKFSINNSFIAVITLVIYIIQIIRFQIDNEFTDSKDIILMIAGLLAGVFIMIAGLNIYFSLTNIDIFQFLAGSVDKRLRKAALSRVRVMNKLKETKRGEINVTNYLDLKLKVRSTAGLLDFYDRSAVLKVFDQNHFNSVVAELLIIIVILLLGIFMENPYFQIPAGASTILMITIFIMLTGAVSYWFRGWSITFVVALFIFINVLVRSGIIEGNFTARGLDYNTGKAEYSLENLNRINSHQNFVRDKKETLEILNKWKAKWPEKEKMIFLCVSGGGQRAALWTVNALQNIDRNLNGQLMNHTQLITGASGGIIGAAFYRELYLRTLNGQLQNQNQVKYLDQISRDNLNAIIYTLMVNDLFIRLQSYEYAGNHYVKDRGYAFENKLNENLDFVFEKQLMDYKSPEQLSEIPMMILTPTILNDGRKLFISPQGLTYMGISQEIGRKAENFKNRGVDFKHLFQSQGASDLHFLSALRMSASFPYITPNVNLPSNPEIEIMDAGISDNYGISDAIRFLFVFQDWISENTSGVVFLIIRDTRKTGPIEDRPNPSIIDKLTYPIAGVYNNLANVQDIRNDERLETAKEWFNGELDVVELEYDTYSLFDGATNAIDKHEKKIKRASLSWHLTTKEKKNIIENIERTKNQNALNKLQRIINSR